MDVTEKEWKYLENQHTMTFARVPYGSRKFEYYFSIEREHLDKSVLTYMARLGYLDTKLLLYIPQSIKLARELGFKKIRKILKRNFYFMPSCKPWFTDEPNPPHTFYETRAKNFHQPLFRYRGQLIATINACMILGATEIRLIGVDLNDQNNFYQYPEILKKVCLDEETINDYLLYEKNNYYRGVNEVKELNPDYNPQNMHSTEITIKEDKWGNREMRGTSDILQWIDKEMKKEGMKGLYCTSKKSLLVKEDKLELKTIMET